MVNGSGYHHSRCQQHAFQNPEPRGTDSRSNATWTILSSGPHFATSPSGFHGSWILDTKFLAARNPERRNPDSSDSCHLSCQRSTAPTESGNRYSRFRRACNSCTCQPRYAEMWWPMSSTCAWRLTLSQEFKSSILFLLKSPSLRNFSRSGWVCSQSLSMGLSLLSLVPLAPPETLYQQLMLELRQFSSVGFLWTLCTHCDSSQHCSFLSLRLTTEISNSSTCTSPTRHE